jgi:S-adenosylmethionine/arginine decarboxylase-like enzyme
MELLLDLKGCDLSDLSRDRLATYFQELCALLGMTRDGDPVFWDDHGGVPHLHGTSALQVIDASSVLVHPLPALRIVYLNIFSCRPFDPDAATRFSAAFWRAEAVSSSVLPRA